MSVRANIASMHGYTPGEQPQNMQSWIKLNTNENPYPPSPQCQAILNHAALDMLRRYPDPCANALRDAIAQRFNYERDNIIVGNGSDDILNIIMRVYLDENDSIAVLKPSYSLYPVLAQIQNAHTVSIPLNADFTLPDEACSLLESCKVLFIPSPNAPTGSLFEHKHLQHIITTFQGVVVIDEAYADFATCCAVDFPKRYSNVIITRTFSKSYALAGARVGYAIADKAIIEQMMKVKDSYNVNALSQALALAAFTDQDYLQQTLNAICAEREVATQRLNALHLEVIASQANFIFVRIPNHDAAACYDYLKSKKILVRYFAAPETADFLRITIGTPEQMSQLYCALHERYA